MLLFRSSFGGFFSSCIIGNAIFMFKSLWKLILKNPPKAILCFVRAKHQRLDCVLLTYLHLERDLASDSHAAQKHSARRRGEDRT